MALLRSGGLGGRGRRGRARRGTGQLRRAPRPGLRLSPLPDRGPLVDVPGRAGGRRARRAAAGRRPRASDGRSFRTGPTGTASSTPKAIPCPASSSTGTGRSSRSRRRPRGRSGPVRSGCRRSRRAFPTRRSSRRTTCRRAAARGSGRRTSSSRGARFRRGRHSGSAGSRSWRTSPAGQKTGFFLDQRENRELVRRHAAGRRVLNLFAYSGAFGVAALAGGAAATTQVDLSAPALELARENHRGTGRPRKAPAPGRSSSLADVFDDLRARAAAGETLGPDRHRPAGLREAEGGRRPRLPGLQGREPPRPQAPRAGRSPSRVLLLGTGRRGALPEGPLRGRARRRRPGPDPREAGCGARPPGLGLLSRGGVPQGVPARGP